MFIGIRDPSGEFHRNTSASWPSFTRVPRQDVPRLRLTLQTEEDPTWRDQAKRKPVGRAYAVVSSRNSGDEPWDWEQDRPANEASKAYLMYEPDIKGKAPTTQESPLRQLQMELAQFKEVRHSMEIIRQNLSAGMSGSQFNVPDYYTKPEMDTREQETEQMREATRRLYRKLMDAEGRHERETKLLEDQASLYKKQLGETRQLLQSSEETVVQQDRRIEELQRLMAGMEQEHRILVTKMEESERQLGEMRTRRQDAEAHQHRSEQLENEVKTLREKISHLSDMLQSQQRKVRQMIEQLQSSRSQIEEKDLLIQQLQERVEHLESENQELQDRAEYLSSSKGIPHHSLTKSSAQALPDQHSLSNRLILEPKKPRALMRVLERQ
ncbi:tuftelin 1a isoform X2 [Hypanus sabinus]|uniref:tuftelin 1a isoform X2 n=1 Tax=Hypanus sabinus TaxID=79690 RepID=UPI0028C441D3|nr:tuftelin 1a isoform X2 [Hypanus sabinus]